MAGGMTDDFNRTAHRVVREATEHRPPDCPECGQPMEERVEHRYSGRAGSDRRDVRHPRVFYVCPNGHEVRLT